MDAYIQQRITAAEARIEAYELAIAGVIANGHASYSFDSGQTKTSVTRQDLGVLEKALQNSIEMREMWLNRTKSNVSLIRTTR